MKRKDVPQFGVLEGLKVVFQAVSIAGPFFGVMCADHGADVIWLEPSANPSLNRAQGYMVPEMDQRNMRNLAIDLGKEGGKEAFLRLMKETDIFLEASKGGQYEKWGLTDEVLWEANPGLIIVHLSGFGLDGDPNFAGRASYDPISQAFGGLMYANSNPAAGTLTPAALNVVDYYTALFCYSAALGAYIKKSKTGIGESIDASQFEAAVRCQGNNVMYSWNVPQDSPWHYRPGKTNSNTAGYDGYKCKDGKFVYMLIFGATMKRAFPIFGLEFGSEEFPAKMIYKDWEPCGQALNAAIQAFCDEHTADEVEEILTAASIPCMQMMSYDDMPNHPHYIARNTVVTNYSRGMKQEVRMSNVYPRMKNSPGKIWRSAPAWGEDTNDILEDLGYSANEISALNENGAVHQGEILD